MPGDCVYVDLNADGEINSNDATRDIGYTDMPEYTAGLNTGFSWKNFDFSMQWTGALECGSDVRRIQTSVG